MQEIAGYLELSKRLFIEEMSAYQYALEQVSASKDLQQEFIEWFFSGNYIALSEKELEEYQAFGKCIKD